MPTCGSVLALLGYLVGEPSLRVLHEHADCLPGGIGVAGATGEGGSPALPASSWSNLRILRRTAGTGGRSTCLYAEIDERDAHQDALKHAVAEADVIAVALLLQDPRRGMRCNRADQDVWRVLVDTAAPSRQEPVDPAAPSRQEPVDPAASAKRAMIACMLVRVLAGYAHSIVSLETLAGLGFEAAITAVADARNL